MEIHWWLRERSNWLRVGGRTLFKVRDLGGLVMVTASAKFFHSPSTLSIRGSSTDETGTAMISSGPLKEKLSLRWLSGMPRTKLRREASSLLFWSRRYSQGITATSGSSATSSKRSFA